MLSLSLSFVADVEEGEFWIEDLSSNGTLVGKKRLRKRRAYPLTHNTMISFGDVVCKFLDISVCVLFHVHPFASSVEGVN